MPLLIDTNAVPASATCIEHASDSVLVLTATGQIVAANPACWQVFAVPPDAVVVGQALSTFLDAPDATTLTTIILPHVAQHGSWHGLLHRTSPDGTTRTLHHAITALPVDDPAQRRHYLAVGRNITAHADQLNDLRVFQQLVAEATDAITVVLEGPGTIIYANTAAAHLYGEPNPAAIMGTSAYTWIDPSEHGRVQTELAPAVATTGRWQGRLLFHHADGTVVPVFQTLFALPTPPDQPRRIAAIAHDLTAQDQAEADRLARTDQQRTFDAMLALTPDPMMLFDLQTQRVTYTNPAFQEQWGYGAASMGMPMNAFITPAEHGRLATHILPQAIAIGAWRGVLAFQRADGSTFQGQATCFVRYAPDGTPYNLGALVRDLTAHEHALAAQLALQTELMTAQQQLVHDLQTPLIPLTNSVVLLPLIGTLDGFRAHHLMETLLAGVGQQRATTTIVDITGVPVVDTHIAQLLVQAAQAVGLLGTRFVLTGIRPDVAQTMVSLGIDLRDIATYGTVQAGIAAALQTTAPGGAH